MDPRAHTNAELLAIVKRYIASVRSGQRTVGKLERAAVERHLRDLGRIKRGKRSPWISTVGPLRFSQASGLRVLRFAERYVRHAKPREWAGRPFRFTADNAWEAFVLFALFGWQRRTESGEWVRRFTEAYLSMARKNGKTFIAAVIVLFMLVASGEAAPECYAAATQKEQAAIAWKMAAAIVRKSPELASEIGLPKSRYQYSMWLKADPYDSVFKALSRNDDEFDGLSPYVALLDEVHAHPDSGLHGVLTEGMGARIDPLALLITTRGHNPEGFCGQVDKVAQQIVTGVLDDDSKFVFICALDEGDKFTDEGVWPKANPNIGVTVHRDYLRRQVRVALNEPAKQHGILCKNFNQWTAGSLPWLSLEKWDACRADPDIEAFRGMPAFLSADLSKSADFTAAILLVLPAPGVFLVRPHFWIPESTVEEAHGTRRSVPIRAWAQQGYLTITPGEIVDQDSVKEQLLAWRNTYRVREMVFDQAQSWKLSAELQGLGCTVVHHSQAWAAMHAATKETEDLITTARLAHGGNPILRWMFTNVALRENATGLRRPDKQRSADSIDGISALVMAIGRATAHDKSQSGYNRGKELLIL